MRKLWIKKPIDRKGYSFWDTEVSDDEKCLTEEDFKNSVCFVPEARYKELEKKFATKKVFSEIWRDKAIDLEKKLGITIKLIDLIQEDPTKFEKIELAIDEALLKLKEMEGK